MSPWPLWRLFEYRAARHYEGNGRSRPGRPRSNAPAVTPRSRSWSRSCSMLTTRNPQRTSARPGPDDATSASRPSPQSRSTLIPIRPTRKPTFQRAYAVAEHQHGESPSRHPARIDSRPLTVRRHAPTRDRLSHLPRHSRTSRLWPMLTSASASSGTPAHQDDVDDNQTATVRNPALAIEESGVFEVRAALR